MYLLPGVGMFVAAMILAVTVLLAVAECSVAEGIRWRVVISLAGGFLNLVKSNPITFCFSSGTDMGLSSLVEGISHDLVTNKFAVAGKVEGHGVVALEGLDIVGRVVVAVVIAVVSISVTNTWGSTRGFSINLTLYGFLLAW